MHFSINKTAQIFDVDRTTVSSWIRRGLPHIPQIGLGRPAQLSFKEVLAWRKIDMMSQRWGTDESVVKMEAAARERLKLVKSRRQGTRHKRVGTP